MLRREINVYFPVDTGRKLNVRRTFVFWTTYLHSFYVLCLRGCEEIFTMDEIKRLNGLFFFLYQVLSNLKVHQMFQQPFLTSFCILHNLPIENPSPDYHRLHYFQKHPSRGVLRKRCSGKGVRRTSMPKCDFNKLPLQLYWNRALAWL